MKFNANRLRKLREDRGLTQNQLAKKAKISPTYVSKIERGAANPSLPVLEKLAQVLGVSPSYFFENDVPFDMQETRLDQFLDLETYLQKILAGEIPIHFAGVDKLTPEVEEDIRTVLKVALTQIQLRKELEQAAKKADAAAEGVMCMENPCWGNQQRRTDTSCSSSGFPFASARSSLPSVCLIPTTLPAALASLW